MLQRKGLLCVVKAMAAIFILALAMPTPVSAQSDMAARVKIHGPAGMFGDVLLVRDEANSAIVVYGLSNAAPGQGQVIITPKDANGANTQSPISVNSSYVGKFPILRVNPIQIDTSSTTPVEASIEARRGGATIGSGTFTLEITGAEVQNALLSGDMPPHRLIQIVPSAGYESLSSYVGQILLTQRVLESGTRGIITDEFEGISNSVLPGSGLAETIRTVTPFSQIGVYSKPVDPVSPDRTFRIHTLTTETYYDNAFRSNGAFLPFAINDVNSFNVDTIDTDVLAAQGASQSPTETVYLRIQAVKDLNPTTGNPPLQFLAQFSNDVAARIDSMDDPVNNNPDANNQFDPNAPMDQGIAVISGTTIDPYSLITAHIANSTESEVLVSTRADANGEFSLIIPTETASPTFDLDELYLPRQRVYLTVSDPFGNVSVSKRDQSLREVLIDETSTIVNLNDPVPPADASPRGLYELSGTVEPLAKVLVNGYTRNDTEFRAGQTTADNTGAFVLDASPAYEYVFISVDQAGNISDPSGRVRGKTTTANPVISNLRSEFPFIRLTGTAEPGIPNNATTYIRVFGFPAGEIPQTADAVDELPEGASFLAQNGVEYTGIADENGNFSVVIPSLVSRVVYVQSVDFIGNESQYVRVELVDPNTGEPLTSQLITVDVTSVQNKPPRVPDVVRGQLLDPVNGTPINNTDGTLFVSAFSGLLTSVTTAVSANQVADGSLLDVTFPFVDEIADMVAEVNADGSFTLSVLDCSRLTNDFIHSFFVVALELVVDFDTGDTFYRPIGFEPVDENDGLDRTGPQIVLTPSSSDISVTERGAGLSDVMDIRRIYPAEMNMGDASLPADASPFVVVFVDDTIRRNQPNARITSAELTQDSIIYTLNTAGFISQTTVPVDVNSPYIRKLATIPLNAVLYFTNFGMLPIPGVSNINLGENYWNRFTQSIDGYPVVFVALIDSNGNLSPNPIPVPLDVTVKNPDVSLIEARPDSVVGQVGAVEANSIVSIYANADRSEWIATTEANEIGGFAFNNVTFPGDEIYLNTRDLAGNESVAVRIEVDPNVPQFTQFLILDSYGLIHTRSTAIPTAQSADSIARAMAGVEKTATEAVNVNDPNAPFYVLFADGMIKKVGEIGDEPLGSETFTIAAQFARDIEVIQADPFQGYVLLGNGTIVPFGGAPFYGDIITLQRGDDSVPERTRISGSVTLYGYDGKLVNPNFSGANLFFDDVNGNGRMETEDTNQNGQLDRFVLPGGDVRNEDVNGNNRLDKEYVDLGVLGQGFFIDIARDLEIVRDIDGEVLGYVILDGNGIIWPFFMDEDEQNRQSAFYQALSLPTNGFSPNDVFKAVELIVDESGLIQDYVMLDGFGHLFGVPGGMLGAGASDDVDNRGILTGVMGAPIFESDIARDLRMNTKDSNEDGAVNWQDGFYVLDGYGTLYAVGGAPEIEGTPFLGIDVATDIEFGAQPMN